MRVLVWETWIPKDQSAGPLVGLSCKQATSVTSPLLPCTKRKFYVHICSNFKVEWSLTLFFKILNLSISTVVLKQKFQWLLHLGIHCVVGDKEVMALALGNDFWTWINRMQLLCTTCINNTPKHMAFFKILYVHFSFI